jgi:hypothetical protein
VQNSLKNRLETGLPGRGVQPGTAQTRIANNHQMTFKQTAPLKAKTKGEDVSG